MPLDRSTRFGASALGLQRTGVAGFGRCYVFYVVAFLSKFAGLKQFPGRTDK